MEKDQAYSIFIQNQSELIFCEVLILLDQLKSQKPHLNILQYICSEHKYSAQNYYTYQSFGQYNGASIIIRVYDTEKQMIKSLKVFFLDRFKDKSFVQEVFEMFDGAKTLLRQDLILQIYDDYQLYLVVEQEDIEAKLSDYQQRFPEELEHVMKTAINYFCNRTFIKQKSNGNEIAFPKGYFQYFYIVKGENDEVKIKINPLSYEIFMNPLKYIQISSLPRTKKTLNEQYYLDENEHKNKNKDKFEILSEQLKNTKNNLKIFSSVKKENLVQTIQEFGQLLLTYHEIKIFETIAQNPLYDDFELLEFGEFYFILGSKVQGSTFFLKAEKFQSQYELEKISKQYQYGIENHIFTPIENQEQIIFENNFYLLIQEKPLPTYNQLMDNKEEQDYQYKSLEQILKSKYLQHPQVFQYLIQKQLINLQIVIQLIKLASNLHQYNLYGQLTVSHIMVDLQGFSSKPPQILISNPLFIMNQIDKRQQQSINQENISNIEQIISQLLQTIENQLIDFSALKVFQSQIQMYLQNLIKQSSLNIEIQQDIPIIPIISRLEYLFKIFEDLYNDLPEEIDQTHPYKKISYDQQIKLNKKQLVTVVNSNKKRDTLDQSFNPRLFQFGFEKVKYINNSDDFLGSILQNTSIITLKIKEQLEQTRSIQNYFSFAQFNDLVQALQSRQTLQQIDIQLTKQFTDNREIYQKLLENLNSKYRLTYNDIKYNLSLLNLQNENQNQQMNKGDKNQYVYHTSWYRVYSAPFKKSKNIFEESQLNLLQDQKESKQLSEQQNQIQNSIKEQLNTENQKILNENILKQQQKQQTQISISNVEEQQSYTTELIQYANNIQILDSFFNKDRSIIQYQQIISSYFNEFGNQQESANLKKLKQFLIEKINQVTDAYKYINCFVQKINDADRNLLVLEFNNIFKEDSGKLKIRLWLQNENEIDIVSHYCKSYERFICYLKEQNTLYHVKELVESWIICEYISEMTQSIYQPNQKQLCKHQDQNFMQAKLYQNQLSLRKLSIYFDYCDITKQQMMNTSNYFQFSNHLSKSLIYLNFKITNSKKEYQINFIKCIIKHLECAESLRKLKVQFEKPSPTNSVLIDFRRQFLKMKRLVLFEIKVY